MEQLFNELKKNQNIVNAEKMSNYMRNQFIFLGIRTPLRHSLCKPYFKEMKNKEIDWNFVNKCWEQPEREFQYVAIDYLKMIKSKLSFNDLDKLEKLVIEKSWWDSVDGLHKLFGEIALKAPDAKYVLYQYSLSNNMWLKRIAINHQMGLKQKTDTELFEAILKNNLNETEFFINKAIGWSLRDYSKFNPSWVSSFIDQNKKDMSNLSIIEASKYL